MSFKKDQIIRLLYSQFKMFADEHGYGRDHVDKIAKLYFKDDVYDLFSLAISDKLIHVYSRSSSNKPVIYLKLGKIGKLELCSPYGFDNCFSIEESNIGALQLHNMLCNPKDEFYSGDLVWQGFYNED